MRPVLAGIVSDYVALNGGRSIFLVDVAEMNDALDVQSENDRRLRAYQERNR